MSPNLFPDFGSLDMHPPTVLQSIITETEKLDFDMPSAPETGALLRTLAGLGPDMSILELGTGTGFATCWILDGLQPGSRLISIDNDPTVTRIAKRHLGGDTRLELVAADGDDWLMNTTMSKFNLIFADAWPGKFSHLQQALALLAKKGIYVVDDLLPQKSWPENHAPRVEKFLHEMHENKNFQVDYREWSTGILIARKRR